MAGREWDACKGCLLDAADLAAGAHTGLHLLLEQQAACITDLCQKLGLQTRAQI